MNLHKTADRLVAAIGGLYSDSTKFFREGTESPHLSEVIADTTVETPAPAEEREYEVAAAFRDISATARYTVLRWSGAAAPTLIYHHGSGESNYTARIRRYAARMNLGAGNIIAVSIPFNRSLKEYLSGAARLDRWSFLLAASVQLTEHLVQHLRASGSTWIVCAGISLGGWITNLHHSYLDTCDAYSPIFAGAALDDLFINTVYRKLLASSAQEANERFRSALNFESDFTSRGNANVFPVMARFDQFIRFERQSGIYRPEQMTVLERSHTTGAVAYARIGAHLQERLDACRTE
jgi:hypothetical protein